MNACEVCAEHGVHRKGPRFRIAETWLGQMGLYLCKRHALALTMRTLRAELPVARDARLATDGFGTVRLCNIQ